MITVQKVPLIAIPIGTGYPYQRSGLSKLFYPYQRYIKNCDSNKLTGTERPYQRLYQTYHIYGTERVHPYIYKGCTVPKVELN